MKRDLMDMIVTDLIDISKKQCKVMIDDEFAFVLYKGELHLYGISVGKEMTEACYHKIVDEVLCRRCKLRAMNLLKERIYSEKRLREKLINGNYPSECVDAAIEYVKSFGYVDDVRYAQDFLFYHGKKLNRQQIFLKLRQRGIADDIIRDAYQSFCESGEKTPDEELIHRQLHKKHFPGLEFCTTEDKNKFLRSLIQKGFSMDVVLRAMQSFVCGNSNL